MVIAGKSLEWNTAEYREYCCEMDQDHDMEGDEPSGQGDIIWH